MRREVICPRKLSTSRILSVIDTWRAVPDSDMIGSREQFLVSILRPGLAPKFSAEFAEHDAACRFF